MKTGTSTWPVFEFPAIYKVPEMNPQDWLHHQYENVNIYIHLSQVSPNFKCLEAKYSENIVPLVFLDQSNFNGGDKYCKYEEKYEQNTNRV